MDTTIETTEPSSGEILAGLLGQVAHNNQGAMAELYGHTHPLVYRLTLRILQERSAAEDATQEVYTQIWRKAEAFDPARGNAWGWIVAISRSRALDKLRFSKARLNYDGESDDLDSLHSSMPGPEHSCSDSERSRLVRRFLFELPPDQRRLIEMAFFEGLTQSEIARQTALPLGTIKTRIRSGMRRLREQLIALDHTKKGDWHVLAMPLPSILRESGVPRPSKFRERPRGRQSLPAIARRDPKCAALRHGVDGVGA